MIQDWVRLLREHPAAALVCFAPVALLLARRPPAGLRGLLGAGAALGAALFAAAAIWYLVSPAWIDHVEPHVACVSALVARGEPAYHALDAAERYSALYGPNVYLPGALAARWFGASTVAVKLPGVLFGLASLVLVARVVARDAGRAAVAAGVAFLVCAALLFHGPYAFYVRGDPQLLFWASLGLWACRSGNRTAAALLTGLACGAAAGVKVHAPAYFLPLFALLLDRHGRGAVVTALLAATGAAALPFALFPEFSFAHYRDWLGTAASHRFALAEALALAERGAFLALPLVVLAAAWRSADPDGFGGALRRHRTFAAALVTAVLLVAAAGSKEGAGAHHLIPFAPVLSLVAATLAMRLVGLSQVTTTARVLLVASAGSGLLLAAREGIEDLYLLRSRAGDGAIAAELATYVREHAGRSVAMACGTADPGYASTGQRTALVFAGQPYPVCPAALMDMVAAHLEVPPATLESLRRGAVEAWLVPKGDAPFGMRSFYARDGVRMDLFGDAFRAAFLGAYARTGETATFDVWTFTGGR